MTVPGLESLSKGGKKERKRKWKEGGKTVTSNSAKNILLL